MATPTPLPRTMRAWLNTLRRTPPASLTLRTDTPLPAAPSGADLLIRATHVALNPADVVYMSLLPSRIPFVRRDPVPGLDFAGEVVLAGPAAPANLGPGARVCGAAAAGMLVAGRGTLAEYLCVPSSLVAVVPAGLGMAEAAGLGIVGQTATLALREAGVRDGDRVFVNGASGGLGSMLVQLCKGHGARVVASCSGGNVEMVKRLGADEIIDYTAHEPLHAYLAAEFGNTPFDYIFDCVGHDDLYDQSPKYLKASGKLVCLVGGKGQGVYRFLRNALLPVYLGGTPRAYKLLGLLPAGDLQRQVATWVEEGLIKEVPIDSEWEMEDVPKAYERVISKRSKGKVVIKVHPRD